MDAGAAVSALAGLRGEEVPVGAGAGGVIAQVGAPLPTGAQSGVYEPGCGQFTKLETCVREAGQRRGRELAAVLMPYLSPGR